MPSAASASITLTSQTSSVPSPSQSGFPCLPLFAQPLPPLILADISREHLNLPRLRSQKVPHCRAGLPWANLGLCPRLSISPMPHLRNLLGPSSTSSTPTASDWMRSYHAGIPAQRSGLRIESGTVATAAIITISKVAAQARSIANTTTATDLAPLSISSCGTRPAASSV